MITQMSLEHKSKKEKKVLSNRDQFPIHSHSFELGSYCSTFSVSSKQLHKPEKSIWLFGLFLVETTGKDGSMEEPKSSQENKLHHWDESNQSKAFWIQTALPPCTHA